MNDESAGPDGSPGPFHAGAGGRGSSGDSGQPGASGHAAGSSPAGAGGRGSPGDFGVSGGPGASGGAAALPVTPPGAASGAQHPGAGPAFDVDQLAGLVYERLSDRLGHRGARPGDMPPVEEAIALREQAPELYDLWLRIAQERAETGNYVQRAPYEVPERLAQSGRPRALSALLVVLAFCGYLAWLGGPGPYIAGLIAVLDLIVMLGLFFGLRPEHLSSDPRHPRRRRLTLSACGRLRPTSAPGRRRRRPARAATAPSG